MTTKTKFFFFSAVILSLLLWAGVKLFQPDEVAIHIAFVGPMSGENANVGNAMVQAIELYLNTINEQGGIHQKKVILDTFDDRNDPELAFQKAQEIVAQNQAIAVIGHNYSACSIRGGKVYKEYGIPAITPASTHVEVTQGNEWYFRTIFNDHLQTRLLANYAKRLLQQNMVSIIYTDTSYGSDLASLFEKASQELIDIKHKWRLSSDKDLDTEIDRIVNELQAQPDAGLILLATHATEGVKIIKRIKDAGIKNPLLAPDSYASNHFVEGFVKDSKEKQIPGYYSNGLYVSTPFLLDTANRQARYFNTLYQKQYSENLPWQGFYAVDAAMVLIEALKQGKIQALPDTLASDRKQIRNFIASHFNTVENAVVGNTGFNYFDDNGDSPKTIAMGVYKNNQLISAFNQLQKVSYSPERTELLESARQLGRVLLVDNQYMYKTDIVYTGIQLNRISQFEPKTATYTLDFYLWFRFQNVIQPQNITFLNAVEPITLGTPIIAETVGKETYQLYEISGKFKENVHLAEYHLQPDNSFIRHSLGISFRHRDLDRNHLIYVTDVLGMELAKESAFLGRMKEIQERSALDNWVIQKIDFFQGTVKQKLLGNPKYLVSGNAIEYSTFNTDIWVSNNIYHFYTLIPFPYLSVFFVLSAIITLLLIFVSYQDNQISRLKYLWFFQIIFTFLLLISTQMFVINWIIEHFHSIPIETVRTVFQVLWWLIPAILLNMAVERFIWLPLEEKTGRTVPNLMRVLVALLIYTLALFGITAFVFKHPITSLLATSGVFAMIVGFAVQMNLSNVFSGIALNIERSFRIGDWVKIGSFDEGKVVNMNWRVTQIETRRGYILSIPNSTIANSDIHNFSYPDEQYWLICRVPIDSKQDPRRVEEILAKAVLAVKQDVVKDFIPSVWIDNLQAENVNDWVANYLIFFKTENYLYKFRVLKNVWKSIWIHLNQANIIPTAMIQSQEGQAQEMNSVAIPSEVAKVLNKNQLHNMVVGS